MTAKEFSPRPFVQCDYELGCGHEAFAKPRIGSTLTNVCRNHYHAHFANEAKAFCERNGLHTVPQMRAWIKERMATFGNPSLAGRWWIDRLAERAANGETLSALQLDAIRKARGAIVEREPGSDDEELEAA